MHYIITYARTPVPVDDYDCPDSENGFVDVHGNECPSDNAYLLSAADINHRKLRDALDYISPVYASSSHPSAGDWFNGSEEQDYHTGESVVYSLHPPRDITPSSMRRLARVLGIR